MPSLLVTIVTSYHSSLPCVDCAETGRSATCSARRISASCAGLGGSSYFQLLNAALALWSSAMVGAFLRSHVSIGGGLKLLEFSGHAVRAAVGITVHSAWFGHRMPGSDVAAAFRQGPEA